MTTHNLASEVGFFNPLYWLLLLTISLIAGRDALGALFVRYASRRAGGVAPDSIVMLLFRAVIAALGLWMTVHTLIHGFAAAVNQCPPGICAFKRL